MRYQTLGRTGLNVSVAGLGCGGHSRLGTAYGKDLEHAASIVRLAVEHGVNLIDTAESYKTEPAVALALRDLNRDELVLSTKAGLWTKGDAPMPTAAQFAAKLDASLRTLGVETIDLYHLHALVEDQIDYALSDILPVMERAKRQGKVRFLAVSEMFHHDAGHATLPALMERTDVFDVMMVGFNALNPSARERVFPKTIERGIGVEVMFAVRRAMTNPEHLRKTVQELVDSGQVDAEAVDLDDPLGFLVDDDTPTVMDAGYRFCLHEPGCHTVLFGTGDPDHLRDNLVSLGKGPLSPEKQAVLRRVFGRVDSVSGN